MSRKRVEINPECGRRLKELLVENGMTQKELSKRLNCEAQHISNIIRGKRSLTLDMAQRIAEKVFPGIFLVEWLLGISDCKTQEEKDAYSQKVWEENYKAELIYDKVFRCFIEGLEDMQGYGLHTGNVDELIGEYVAVTNVNGDPVGAIPFECFQDMQAEVENYASYLIQRIIKKEMVPIPGGGKESIDKWLTFKSAGTNPES